MSNDTYILFLEFLNVSRRCANWEKSEALQIGLQEAPDPTYITLLLTIETTSRFYRLGEVKERKARDNGHSVIVGFALLYFSSHSSSLNLPIHTPHVLSTSYILSFYSVLWHFDMHLAICGMPMQHEMYVYINMLYIVTRRQFFQNANIVEHNDTNTRVKFMVGSK